MEDELESNVLAEPVSNIAYDVGRLVSYVLRSKARPAGEAVYADLLKRYESDSKFRTIADGVLEGMGFRILEICELSGLVVAPESSSPWAFRNADFRSGMSVEERLIFGSLSVMIAAYLFPAPEKLEMENSVYPGTLVEDEFLKFASSTSKALGAHAETDPEWGRADLLEVWRLIVDRAAETNSERLTHKTLRGMIHHLCLFLCEQGLFTTEDAKAGKYRPTPRFRVMVRDLAQEQWYALIKKVRGGEHA